MTELLKSLPSEYVQKQFCSPLTHAFYEQLFRLSVEVFQNKSWEGVKKLYGVTDEPGCLREWSEAVKAQFLAQEPNRKVREIGSICLDDFLMLALDNDYELFLYGSSKEILSHLRQKVFDRTSDNFLGLLIRRIAEREKERLPETTEMQLKAASQERADRIISSFENKFYAKDQTTHRDLFRVIRENPDWLLEQLRK